MFCPNRSVDTPLTVQPAIEQTKPDLRRRNQPSRESFDHLQRCNEFQAGAACNIISCCQTKFNPLKSHLPPAATSDGRPDLAANLHLRGTNPSRMLAVRSRRQCVPLSTLAVESPRRRPHSSSRSDPTANTRTWSRGQIAPLTRSLRLAVGLHRQRAHLPWRSYLTAKELLLAVRSYRQHAYLVSRSDRTANVLTKTRGRIAPPTRSSVLAVVSDRERAVPSGRLLPPARPLGPVDASNRQCAHLDSRSELTATDHTANSLTRLAVKSHRQCWRPVGRSHRQLAAGLAVGSHHQHVHLSRLSDRTARALTWPHGRITPPTLSPPLADYTANLLIALAQDLETFKRNRIHYSLFPLHELIQVSPVFIHITMSLRGDSWRVFSDLLSAT
ncbi:hypothetical protein C8R45DRAFT_1066086 [Mycena sanguinolenta]|nr:hypothetical protein C8R45DRAFT_1066086 [Mycena sanguinolenta]